MTRTRWGTACCLDPFGFEQFVTALIFAHDRWGSTGAINYQKDALALFHTMKHKVEDNGGTGTATNLFDATAHLPYAYPRHVLRRESRARRS